MFKGAVSDFKQIQVLWKSVKISSRPASCQFCPNSLGCRCQFYKNVWGYSLLWCCSRLHCIGISVFPLNSTSELHLCSGSSSVLLQNGFSFVNTHVCSVRLVNTVSEYCMGPNGSVGSKLQQCGGAQFWYESTEVMHFASNITDKPLVFSLSTRTHFIARVVLIPFERVGEKVLQIE